MRATPWKCAGENTDVRSYHLRSPDYGRACLHPRTFGKRSHTQPRWPTKKYTYWAEVVREMPSRRWHLYEHRSGPPLAWKSMRLHLGPSRRSDVLPPFLFWQVRRKHVELTSVRNAVKHSLRELHSRRLPLQARPREGWGAQLGLSPFAWKDDAFQFTPSMSRFFPINHLYQSRIYFILYHAA